MGFQRILNILQAINATVDTSMATIMTLVSVVIFITFTRQPIVPTFTVFSIGFYMRLCNTMGFNFTRALTGLVNARVSIKRLDKFLLNEELATLRKPNVGRVIKKKPLGVEMRNFNYHWSEVRVDLNRYIYRFQILYRIKNKFSWKIKRAKTDSIWRTLI